jgi:hypothetical protein
VPVEFRHKGFDIEQRGPVQDVQVLYIQEISSILTASPPIIRSLARGRVAKTPCFTEPAKGVTVNDTRSTLWMVEQDQVREPF